MAAAAAGAGAGVCQEKQFPPALLSFFIYNPRFGPREGEVRRDGPRGRQPGSEEGRGSLAGVGPRELRGAPGRRPGSAGASQHLSALLERHLPTLLCARCAPGRWGRRRQSTQAGSVSGPRSVPACVLKVHQADRCTRVEHPFCINPG